MQVRLEFNILKAFVVLLAGLLVLSFRVFHYMGAGIANGTATRTGNKDRAYVPLATLSRRLNPLHKLFAAHNEIK